MIRISNVIKAVVIVIHVVIISGVVIRNTFNEVYAAKPTYEEGTPVLTIALDPGHGGNEQGADYYGKMEKDIDLQLAGLVKEGLEQFDNVKVILTRTGDYAVDLKERADIAAAAGADMFISLHCNASVLHMSRGASVYISTGELRRDELRDFADLFLGEFEAIGLENAGTFARVTQMGGRREDGSFDDYYGVLRHSYNNGIPALLVEHCYMDNYIDSGFVRSYAGIKKLAKADVDAIAAYYGLADKDGTVCEKRHARHYGASTKAVTYNYYEPPKLMGITLTDYGGGTPGMATYNVDMEDGIGITSMYLVYKNDGENYVTISLLHEEELMTGTYELKAYIPDNLELGKYYLSYVGMYNKAGYDAGYNISGGKLMGFGNCEWLNSFNYNGTADMLINDREILSAKWRAMLDERISSGLRNRQRGLKSPTSLARARLGYH